MTKSDLMRRHIADTFKDLLQSKPYNSITIQDIANEADINRKTFYYYFYNKLDLVCYIFRKDLSKCLTDNFPDNELIRDPDDEDDKYRDMPFFVNNLTDPEDRRDFYLELSSYIKENDNYYYKLSLGEDFVHFEKYLDSIYLPQLKKTINRAFEEQGVVPPSEDVDYLAAYFT
ncbi:MAG: TetR/AcrR family transcriptional regulator, partial [Eggerthellaceae bacterium]|nr:TetR/AcrR family transcriptional regulator [Eggerthellaceae bacterium]